MTITLYGGAKNPVPLRADELSWNETVDAVRELLDKPPERAKLDLLAIAPHRLSSPHRCAANVESVDALVIDVDQCDLANLDTAIHREGIAAIVYGSPSDDPTGPLDARRMRVIAPISRGITPAECRASRLAFAERLDLTPGQGVEGATDAAKLFFVGRTTDDPSPRECRVYEGCEVDVDPLLALPLRCDWSGSTAPATAATTATPAPSRIREAASWAIVAALGASTDHDGRKHDICGAIGGLLRKLLWSRDDAAEIIRAWLSDAGPECDVDAGVRWACAAWDHTPDEVSGRQALDRIVGDHLGSAIQECAMLPWRTGVRGVADAPAPTPLAEYATLDLVDISLPPPPLRYICEGLDLAAGKVSAIQGYAYTAKTPTALLLAACVAAGIDFLGSPTRQCAVGYLDHEGGVLTQERLARICDGLDIDRSTLPLTFARAEFLSEAMLDDIERLILSRSLGLLIVDTYSSALPPDVATFNDSGFRQWATALARLGDHTGACIVLVLHERKSAGGAQGIQGISGHGSLAGAIQTAWALHRPDEAAPTTIEMSCARAARHGFDPIQIEWSDRSDGALIATRTETATPSATPTAKRDATKEALTVLAGERIMRGLGHVLTPSRALIALGGEGPSAGQRALARLLDGGQIVRQGDLYATTADHTTDDARVALGRVGGFTR